jgi:hypothetical protein
MKKVVSENSVRAISSETTSWHVADLTPEKWVDKKLSLKKAA